MKKQIKKTRSILTLSLVLAMFMSISTASAAILPVATTDPDISQTSAYIVTEKHAEIVNDELLLDRAINDVHDASREIVDNVIGEISIGDDSDAIKFAAVSTSDDVLKTTQLLEERMYENGANESLYLTTVITDVSFVEDALGSATPVVTRAAHTKEEDNNTGYNSDVRVYCKIYYTSGIYSGAPYVQLTKVEGTFTLLDSQCKINAKYVRGYWGGITLDIKVTRYDSPWYQKTGNPISQAFTGERMCDIDGISIYEIGGTAKCSVSRGTQSWDLTLDCKVEKIN